MDALDSFAQVFDLVKQKVSEQLSDIAYSLWIRDIEPVRFEDSTVYIKVKSEFKKDIIEEKYIPVLQKALYQVMGFDVAVSVGYDPQEHKPAPAASPESDFSDYEYTFDSFIVGNSNKFAHAASIAVAANPGAAYNPLFIYGSSGLGKTHLLYAISADIKKDAPDTNIVFVKGEQFANEIIEAIGKAKTKDFRDKYRVADVLMMDDVQFIGGKESTQEEFFHTFNELYLDGRQIVLTSDRPPKEIKTLDERLRTRFEWGLLADIQPPDFETRTAIITRKAERLGFEIPMDVNEYIANRLKTNIRQLEGAVKKINAFRLMDNEPPSIKSAQNAIHDILTDNQPVPVTIDRVIGEVARTFNVLPEDIRSNKRSAAISKARQISIFVVREVTQVSMAVIGDEFGGRDHATIIYSLRQVGKNMKIDSRYREIVEDILKNIRSNAG